MNCIKKLQFSVICILLVVFLFPLHTIGETITIAAIESIGNEYNYTGGVKYWQYSGNISNTSYMGSENIGTGYVYKDFGNGSWYQCAGFALFMGYALTGEDPVKGANWQRFTSFDAAGSLQIGDIVGIAYRGINSNSTHMAMVSSITTDGKYLFVQATGGENNKIYWNHNFCAGAVDKDGTRINYGSAGNTIEQLKYIQNGTYSNGVVVYRYTGNHSQNIQTDNYTDASSKIRIITQHQDKYKNLKVPGNNDTVYDGGCGLFSIAHAVQWLANKSVSADNEYALINKLVGLNLNTISSMTTSLKTLVANDSGVTYHQGALNSSTNVIKPAPGEQKTGDKKEGKSKKKG